MKLFSKPGACSTADHIALQWTEEPFEVEILTADDLKSARYLAINPAGSVPALQDGDFVLTQNAAILGYIADCRPAARLTGDGSPRQRAEANRWLAFVNSDLHPAFQPLFSPSRFVRDDAGHDALKDTARSRVRTLFERAAERLDQDEWLAGFRSYADPYFYMTLRWADRTGVSLDGLTSLAAFRGRMEADPGVRAALEAEGLS